MLTASEIQKLITSPKRIARRDPPIGYHEKDGTRRCSLDLKSINNGGKSFAVFIRQNSQFIENYSIGLLYRTEDRNLGTIPLVRYNGPHGETSHDKDGHYAKPHIHRMTAEAMRSGSSRPEESRREITDRYNAFETALVVFFNDVGATNWQEHFPELNQPSLFNGFQ